MKFFLLAALLIFSKFADAHQPDISSLMIYEQNGKSLLIIRSALTAFEGEVNYNFGDNAYKNPAEFQALVIRHFNNNCFIVINNDTVRFANPAVKLGHEATIFAELINMPKAIESLHVKNSIFKDMPHNQCELIITIKGLPQKQYILSSDNKHEVMMKVENGIWVVKGNENPIFNKWNVLIFSVALIALIGVVVFIKKKYATPIINAH